VKTRRATTLSFMQKFWFYAKFLCKTQNGDFKKTLQNLTTLFGEILTLDLTFVCT